MESEVASEEDMFQKVVAKQLNIAPRHIPQKKLPNGQKNSGVFQNSHQTKNAAEIVQKYQDRVKRKKGKSVPAQQNLFYDASPITVMTT